MTTIVRPAEPGDAAAIARVLTASLESKFRPAFGSRAAEAMTAVIRHDLGRPSLRHWVADEEGSVVGAVRLALEQVYDGGFFSRVAGVVGWLGAMRATLVLGMLTHRNLAEDEAYVEELAVAASARRRGIGRALLDACAEEAQRRGKRRLTLWVAAGNEPAIALYAADGFALRRRRHTLVGAILYRVPAALLMEKSLVAW